MHHRLLYIALLLLLTAGCAKLPDELLSQARTKVSMAYADGAAELAPGEYQLASSALQAAEQQIAKGEYQIAERTLALSSRYADEALSQARAEKDRIAEEQAQIEEQQHQAEVQRQREEKRQAELRQAELKRQRERELAMAKPKVEPLVSAPVEVEPESEQKPLLVDQVEVLSGENLAMVAARPEVYNDAQLWPLIYKANRDQIKDPTEIFAGQILVVPRDKSRGEVDAARREAQDLDLF